MLFQTGTASYKTKVIKCALEINEIIMEGQTVCQSADALQLQIDTYFSHLFIGSFMSFYTDSGS